MRSHIVDLTYIQAAKQWRLVDEAEREAVDRAKTLDRCKADLVWANGMTRGVATEAVRKAQLDLANAKSHLQQLRRRALLLSGQASQRNWGVALGREYRFLADSQERLRFTVDFLRPAAASADEGLCTFICAGDGPGGREMVFLGLDQLEAHEVQSNVISLANVMRSQP